MVEFCVRCSYRNEDIFPLSSQATICPKCLKKIDKDLKSMRQKE